MLHSDSASATEPQIPVSSDLPVRSNRNGTLLTLLRGALHGAQASSTELNALEHACGETNAVLPIEKDAYTLEFAAKANGVSAGTLKVTANNASPLQAKLTIPAWVIIRCNHNIDGTSLTHHPDFSSGRISELLDRLRAPIERASGLRLEFALMRVQLCAAARKWMAGLEWSSDRQRLGSAHRDGSIRLWDLHRGGQMSSLVGHAGPIAQLAWSNNGERLASSGYDGTVRVWNAADGAELLHLNHREGAAYVNWNSDGTRLGTMANDGYQRVWDVPGSSR